MYSIADSYFAVPLQLLGTMIISRLLTPAETGVFAVAAVFAAFASTFRDFGVAEYLIQEKELDDTKIRAALTVNIVISWLMAIILFFGAPFAASFYQSEGVAEVMRLQSVNFLLIPFGAVTMANFRRLLDFRPIFIAGLLSNITTFTVSTACAYRGFGYMSLAWSSLAGVIVTVCVSIWFRPIDFPKWPGINGVGRVVHFGKFASGIYISGQLGKGAPEMILGRALDLVGVALFSRANGLIDIFNRTVLRAVMPVCLPYFAKSNREKRGIVDGYLRSVTFLTSIGWPFLVFIGIESYAAVRIVYGTQWLESVALAQILCAVGSVELVHYLAKEALIARGFVKRSNMLQIGIQTTRIVGLFAVIPFGLSGACWGLLVAACAGTIQSQWHLSRGIGLSVKRLLKSCAPSLTVTCLSVVPVFIWTMINPVDESNFWTHAIGGGVATATSWIIALKALRHPLWNELCEVARSIRIKLLH